MLDFSYNIIGAESTEIYFTTKSWKGELIGLFAFVFFCGGGHLNIYASYHRKKMQIGNLSSTLKI